MAIGLGIGILLIVLGFAWTTGLAHGAGTEAVGPDALIG